MLDWKKISQNILSNIGDQGKLTQYLSDLETEVTTFNTRFTDLEKQSQEQASSIESLQKTNMNLFLKVGNQVPEKIVHSSETKLSYEDLFTEKGDLK